LVLLNFIADITTVFLSKKGIIKGALTYLKKMPTKLINGDRVERRALFYAQLFKALQQVTFLSMAF
jgi:hypothetical protein